MIQSNTMGKRITALLLAIVMILSLAMLASPALAKADIFDEYVTTQGGKINVSEGQATADTTLATVLNKYHAIATAITGILTVTLLIFFLIQITKLGASGDNDAARKRAMTGIIVTGIAMALMGGATIIVGFFWNLLFTTV